MNIREQIAKDIVDVLKDANDPKPILVTREPFEVEKLAITQFPAILVQTGPETRLDESMSLRTGTIEFTIRCYVRGVELDTQKNNIIERVEEQLEINRRRNIGNASIRTQVITVTPIDRLQPLGEVNLTIEVQYSYSRGTL